MTGPGIQRTLIIIYCNAEYFYYLLEQNRIYRPEVTILFVKFITMVLKCWSKLRLNSTWSDTYFYGGGQGELVSWGDGWKVRLFPGNASVDTCTLFQSEASASDMQFCWTCPAFEQVRFKDVRVRCSLHFQGIKKQNIRLKRGHSEFVRCFA
jgi:hypothetical protein